MTLLRNTVIMNLLQIFVLYSNSSVVQKKVYCEHQKAGNHWFRIIKSEECTVQSLYQGKGLTMQDDILMLYFAYDKMSEV